MFCFSFGAMTLSRPDVQHYVQHTSSKLSFTDDNSNIFLLKFWNHILRILTTQSKKQYPSVNQNLIVYHVPAIKRSSMARAMNGWSILQGRGTSPGLWSVPSTSRPGLTCLITRSHPFEKQTLWTFPILRGLRFLV